MSSDSDLFHTQDELEEKGFDLQGNRFVNGEETYLPLYEAKMFHQFDHRYGSFAESESRTNVQLSKASADQHSNPRYTPEPWFWVDETEVEKEQENRQSQFLVFRDIARTTDERTGIFSLIPWSGVSNKAPILSWKTVDTKKAAALFGELNSFPFDFSVRQKVGGVSLNFYIVKQLPVHPPGRYTSELLTYIVPRVMELTYTAWDLAAFADDVWGEGDDILQSAIESQWQSNVDATDSGHRVKTPPGWVEHSDQTDEEFPHPPFMWDQERRRFLRAELDALYGHLYGLSHDELDYILETFPIVKEQDIEDFGDYRTKKLILHCFDQLEEAIEKKKAYDPILDLPAIELGDIRPESESGSAETVDESTHASTPSA
jgi:hypothetical protein